MMVGGKIPIGVSYEEIDATCKGEGSPATAGRRMNATGLGATTMIVSGTSLNVTIDESAITDFAEKHTATATKRTAATANFFNLPPPCTRPSP